MEVIDLALKWVIAPIAAFLLVMYNKQHDHHTSIAVLQSQFESSKVTQEKEYTETRDSLKYIAGKLDNIETALRK